MFVHFRNKRLFWSDLNKGTIESMKFDGSDRKTLISRVVPDVKGMAVEWVTKKLYWVSGCLSEWMC